MIVNATEEQKTEYIGLEYEGVATGHTFIATITVYACNICTTICGDTSYIITPCACAAGVE